MPLYIDDLDDLVTDDRYSEEKRKIKLFSNLNVVFYYNLRRVQYFKDRYLPFSGLLEKVSALSRQFLERYSSAEPIAMFHSE